MVRLYARSSAVPPGCVAALLVAEEAKSVRRGSKDGRDATQARTQEFCEEMASFLVRWDERVERVVSFVFSHSFDDRHRQERKGKKFGAVVRNAHLSFTRVVAVTWHTNWQDDDGDDV